MSTTAYQIIAVDFGGNSLHSTSINSTPQLA